MNINLQTDLKKALFIVWGVIAVVGFVLVLLPFFIQENVLLKTTPVCTASLQGEGSCFFCGMTRGFIALSKGQWQEALLWNSLSLILFVFFIINFILFLISLIYLKNKQPYSNHF